LRSAASSVFSLLYRMERQRVLAFWHSGYLSLSVQSAIRKPQRSNLEFALKQCVNSGNDGDIGKNPMLSATLTMNRKRRCKCLHVCECLFFSHLNGCTSCSKSRQALACSFSEYRPAVSMPESAV
jgi:hypothetical protein